MDAYAGSAIVGRDGTVCGVLVVLSRTPFAQPALAAAVLEVFAARAGVEIEAIETEARLTSANRALRQALTARAASEERLHHFAQASSDWFWEQDADLRFTYISEGLRHVTGIDPTRVIGKSREMLRADGTFHREAASWDTLAATVARRAPFRDFDYMQPSADGRPLMLRISGVPVFDEAGTFCGYRGTGRDVTALYEAQRRTERSEQRLRDGIEAMPAGFALYDADDRLVMRNTAYDALHESLGIPRAEAGVTFETLLQQVADTGHFGAFGTPEDRKAFIARRLEHHRNPDGRPIEQLTPGPRWFEVRERRTAEGGTVLVRADITDRKLSELRLRDAIECLPVGFVMLDAGGRLVLCNRRYRDLYPEAAAHMVPGTPFADIVRAAGTDTAHVEVCVADALETLNQADGTPHQHMTPSGRHVLMSLTRTADGGTVGVHVDITAMVLLQEQLADATRRAEEALAVRTRFLANMSHELRTPLNAVIGFAELMLMETQGPILPKYREFAGIIKQSGEFLLGLIVDILDVAKIEAGKMTVGREPVDLSALVREVEARLSLAAARKGLSLRIETPPEPPVALGDRLRLVQVVQNLVSNAVKFTDTGGVLVRVERHGAEVSISVADTGRGMTGEDIAYAMEPFQQRRGSDSREVIEGTGLGLPLVRALTELHGGRFMLDSRPGEGTVATVWLPAAP
jgi:PAS domain S-box-containing protein